MRVVGFVLVLVMALVAGGRDASAQTPGWFGAEVETVTAAMMAEKGLAVPFGARVTTIEEGSPAALAGLAEGDVVISLNGAPVADAAAFEAAIGQLAVGATADIMRLRGKAAPSALKVTLAENPGVQEQTAAGAPPLLMLDTGGHMGKVQDVVFTPDGNFIVSASDDKVVRIWDWRAGKTVREIRGESGPAAEGKLYAMALSPDGTRMAVAGWTHRECAGRCGEIRLYDFATGNLVALLSGHNSVVNDLAFSRDGRRLVSGSGDYTAIVWDVAPDAGQAPYLLHRLEGHTNDIYSVAFTPDSERVVTGSLDDTLRLWGAEDGKQIAVLTGHKAKVRSLAVSAKDPLDGRRSLIASGSFDGEIRLWDGRTGQFVRTLGRQPAWVGSLAMSPDGTRLISTCGGGPPCYAEPQIEWDVATGKRLVSYMGHDNIVITATISPDQKLAVTAGGDGFPIHIWDLATGTRVTGPDGQPLALAGNGAPAWATGISADGNVIAWGNKLEPSHINARGPLEFELRLPREGTALGLPERIGDGTPTGGKVVKAGTTTSAARDFRRASATHGHYTLRHREGGNRGFDAILEVLRDGKVVATLERGPADGDDHRAYTFTPDGKTIVSGGSWGVIQAFDLAAVEAAAKGGTLKDAALDQLARPFVGHEGDVWAIAPSADGKYLLSGSADQTLRLWNLKTRELIVTLFHGRDGEWAMWTPQGYYTGSPGGGALVGWQINKGSDKAAEYVRGRQLRERLLRPDVVERAIVLGSAEQALKESGLGASSIEALLVRTPPVTLVEAPEEAAGGRALVLVSSEKNPLPILRTTITVSDGKQETTVEARSVPLPPGTPPPEKGATLRGYEVPLFKGANDVRVVAANAAGESEPRTVTIVHNGEGALDARGTLWLLAVGADKYPGAKTMLDKPSGETYKYPDLTYSGADAMAFAKIAETKMKGRHTKVEPTVLVNGADAAKAPTRANILAALKRIKEQSRENDTIVILLAGHGENWTGGRYHFLPTDFKRTDMSQIGENVLDWESDIQPAIKEAKGRKLVFLDACHSANARNKTLLADAEADRFVAFSAAGGDEFASEFPAEGHGVFTFTVMRGLEGAEGALDPLEKAVTVYTLGQYVYVEVRRRTNGKQTPEYSPGGQKNFVLARE